LKTTKIEQEKYQHFYRKCIIFVSSFMTSKAGQPKLSFRSVIARHEAISALYVRDCRVSLLMTVDKLGFWDSLMQRKASLTEKRKRKMEYRL